MKVIINNKVFRNILTFYNNVRKKYANTYSKELMDRNIDEVCDALLNIEDDGRIPMLLKYRNKGYKEIVWSRKGSKSDWYFEYKVELDENNEYYIHVCDAINHRNMYESNIEYAYKNKLYESIMRDVAKIVKKAIINQDK